jgi:nicotinate-nucleotide pyrophosphorylase (carboxylating)
VFHAVDPEIDFETRARDGRSVRCGDSLCAVRGSARSLLTAERTALNFLQRMTGIATLTARFVEAVRPFGVAILDTRKTTPGLRAIEKYAVRCGGGTNHRMGLYDRVLIKDNHRYAWEAETRRPIDEAVQQARLRYPGMLIEVEVESEEELECALRGTPDWVLLDNMPPDQIRRCVRICHGRARLEASGGITLENIRDVAATGVDAISLGCLTHSAPAADLSLEFTDGPGRPPAGARDPE